MTYPGKTEYMITLDKLDMIGLALFAVQMIPYPCEQLMGWSDCYTNKGAILTNLDQPNSHGIFFCGGAGRLALACALA